MRIQTCKKILLSLLCVLTAAAGGHTARAEGCPPPEIKAGAAVLADADSGEVIFSVCADKKMRIASTTKIMSALVVLENLPTDRIIEIRPEWTGIEGSSMYLAAGEKYSVGELLYGMMLASGNDAAEALACSTAGSTQAFAEMMNAKAAELNMSSTHFTNPHGLDDDEHYSTAADMARLAAAAMKNPEFERIVSTESVTVGGRVISNHNKLLRQYDGAIGVKTGYTSDAGRTLVGCARRGDTKLICVTLDDGDDWNDQAALFDWGFENYETVDLSGISCDIEVESGVETAVTAVSTAGKIFAPRGSVKAEIHAPGFVYAPVYRADKAGEIKVYIGGEPAGTFDMVYEGDIALNPGEALNFWERLRWAWFYACRSGYGAYPAIY